MDAYDATVRHSIYVERYKARVAREILERLRKVSGDIYRMVAASNLEDMPRKELDALLREVDRATKQGYEPVTEYLDRTFREFGIYEAQWQAGAMSETGMAARLGVPSDAEIWAAVYSRPFQGKLLKDWLSDMPKAASERIRRVIRQGYVDGLSSAEVARQIRGTQAQQGEAEISIRGAQAMARTAIAHTANAARERVYKQSSVIKGVQWVSVLDHRTTAICRARDGEIYPTGEGPRPPAHIGCRSTVLPVTKRNEEAIREREDYDAWLRRQPKDVQDDILGNAKGELFRNGLTLDRFVDESGHEYTLDQLRAKDATIWQKAFAE